MMSFSNSLAAFFACSPEQKIESKSQPPSHILSVPIMLFETKSICLVRASMTAKGSLSHPRRRTFFLRR